MPYSCTLVGRKWNLHKKDSSDAIGSHNSKRECTQQMRAIYANELNDPKNIVFDGIINSTFGFDYQLANAGEIINVVINSRGGDFFDAIAMHQKLRNSGKQIIVHINPVAISAGAVLALAGDKIYMPENGAMMFHSPMVAPEGMKDADQLEKMTAGLRVAEDMLVNTLMSKTKKTKEECQVIMKDGTWLTAEEAKNIGIVDEIVPIYRDVQIQNYFPERIVNFLKEKQDMPLKELLEQVGVKDEVELVALVAELRKNQIPKPVTYSPSFINMFKQAREVQLNLLIDQGKAIPVVINELKLKFCVDERITLDASTGNQEFESIVNTLSKNEEIISFKGKTGLQKGQLKDDNKGGDEDDNLLARLMEKEKKKAS